MLVHCEGEHRRSTCISRITHLTTWFLIRTQDTPTARENQLHGLWRGRNDPAQLSYFRAPSVHSIRTVRAAANHRHREVPGWEADDIIMRSCPLPKTWRTSCSCTCAGQRDLSRRITRQIGHNLEFDRICCRVVRPPPTTHHPILHDTFCEPRPRDSAQPLAGLSIYPTYPGHIASPLFPMPL